MNRLQNKKISEICYYVFFAIILFCKGIGLYDGQPVFKAALLLAGLFWVGKMISTAYTGKELCIVGAMLLIGFISYRVSGDKGILLYFMMIVGAKNMSLKGIFKVGLFTWLIAFGGMFLLTAGHIIDSPFKVHVKFGELIIRWGLGCSHPNVLHVSYLLLCMFAGYLLAEKMNVKWLLLLMAGNVLTFVYSVSFTGFVAVTGYFVLCAYWMIRKKVTFLEKLIFQGGALGCVIISMLAPLVLTGKLFDILNKLLNTRLRLSRIYLTKYPFSWFGTRISEITTYSSTMDCSYVYAYVAYGVIVFAILLVGYGMIIRKYCKEGRGVELCIILACLVAGITEPFLFNTSFKNISLLFFAELIFEQKTESSEFSKIKVQLVGLFSVLKANGKRLCLVFMLGIVVGACCYGIIKQQPERIIVPRSESDLDESYYTELNIDEKEILADDIVYGKPREGTPWMQISGAAIRLEQIRGMVITGIYLGMVLVFVTAVVCVGRRNVGKIRQKEE